MTDTVTVNVTQDPGWTDSLPLIILLICIVIAAIGFFYGLRMLQRRRHAHRYEHLVADIAEPESLRDMPPEQRP